MVNKDLPNRSSAVVEATLMSLKHGFEKYGARNYEIQEEMSKIPAWILIYSRLGDKVSKLARNVGLLYGVNIREVEDVQKLSKDDLQKLRKVAHDALDLLGYGSIFLAETCRLLNIKPADLVGDELSETYEKV